MIEQTLNGPREIDPRLEPIWKKFGREIEKLASSELFGLTIDEQKDFCGDVMDLIEAHLPESK